MSVSVVVSPRFERKSEPNKIGEGRLALHKITKGGLKQFAQCVVMERALMGAKRPLADLAKQVVQTCQEAIATAGLLLPHL